MFCPQCGTENKDDARFCLACGTPLTPASESPAQPAQAPSPTPPDTPVPAAGNAPADGGPHKSSVVVAVIAAVAAVVAAVVVIAFLLQGNSGTGSPTGDAPAPSSDSQASDGSSNSSEGDSSDTPSLTDQQKMYIAYGKVLDQADTLDYYQFPDAYGVDGYQYALADMTGTGTPSLVVIRVYDYRAYEYAARVFTYDPATGEAKPNTGDDLTWGYVVSGSLDASGVGITTVQPDANMRTIHYTVQEGRLVAQEGTGSEGDEITMYDVNDRSPLDGATNGTLPSLDTQDDPEAAKAQAKADGLDVYQGTGRVMSGHDLAHLTTGDKAMPDAYYGGDAEKTFAILILDQVTDVTCMQSGDPGMRTGKTALICLGTNYVAQMQAYDGKAVSVAIDPNYTYWPSEATVSNGSPEVYKGARVLG